MNSNKEMCNGEQGGSRKFRTSVIKPEMAMVDAAEEDDYGDLLLEDGKDAGRHNVESPDLSNVLMVRWSYICAKLLIALYKENEDKFTSINYKNKQVWQIISSAMQEKGHNFTGEQCDAKWRSLKKVYKKIKHGNRKPLTGKRKWEYFAEMDDILGDSTMLKFETQLSTISDATLDGRLEGAINANDHSNSESPPRGEADEEITSNGTMTPPITGASLDSVIKTNMKSKRTFGDEPDWFRKYRRERQRRHDDVMAFRNAKEHNKQAFRKTLLELLARLCPRTD